MMHTDGTNVNRKIARGAATRIDLVASGRRLFGSQGYGETVPLDKHNTKAAKAKNRRVEFLIVDRGM